MGLNFILSAEVRHHCLFSALSVCGMGKILSLAGIRFDLIVRTHPNKFCVDDRIIQWTISCLVFAFFLDMFSFICSLITGKKTTNLGLVWLLENRLARLEVFLTVIAGASMARAFLLIFIWFFFLFFLLFWN